MLLTLFIATALSAEFAPEVLHVDVKPLQVTSVLHETSGDVEQLRVFVSGTLDDVSKLNLFYGADVDHLRKCAELVLDGPSAVVCKSVARGAGEQLAVLERVGSDGVVEARHRAAWTYTAPSVAGVTGGRDGLPLVVYGEHFGPNEGAYAVEVFVGPYAAHSASAPCVVADVRGTEIRCAALPPGFGAQLFVTVCVAKVCGKSARPLVDYPQPVVEFTRVVDSRLHLFGTGFGPLDAARADGSAPAVTISIDGKPCANAHVVVADREIACDADAEPREHANIVVQRHGERTTAKLLVKRGTPIPITSITPTSGTTDGNYEITIDFLTGAGFSVGEVVPILIGGVPAINCLASSATQVVCAAAPAFFGTGLLVTTSLAGFSSSVTFSYDPPSVTSVSRADTRGGKIFVNGLNFGPSFAPVTVTVGADSAPCTVERNTHTRIQCDAPEGTGDKLPITVTLGGQSSATLNIFGYKRPSIHATTRPHWAGGHLYVRGHNFGAAAHLVSVHIGHDECHEVVIIKKHEEIRCRARPGAADGTEHTVKVRVDGQSSDKEGYSFHHMQFGNNAPQFAPFSDRFVAVAGERLVIKLPASDKDGDEIYFRAPVLPAGATWHRGFGYIQIEYDVPSDLLAYPNTEVNVTAEVAVTDGPGTTTALVHITARACASTQDTCKDLSCVSRGDLCPECPLSHVVRCSASAPILDAASGRCYRAEELMVSLADVAAQSPVAPAGFSVDVGAGAWQSVWLFSAAHAVVGALQFSGVASFGGNVTGAQPPGHTLVCAETAPCDAWAAGAATHSIAVKLAFSTPPVGGVALALPADGAIGPLASDGYGLCLGRYNEANGAWQCVDEALTLRDDMLSGVLTGDGCYALLTDNCPDAPNLDQLDSNGDGQGDVCAGGITLCEDCHDWTGLNVKYLQKYFPQQQQNERDDCAKNQSPLVIVTEDGDLYHADI